MPPVRFPRTGQRGSEFQQISANGNVVVFASYAPDFAPIDVSLTDWLLYWHDLGSGTTRLINHPAGQPGPASAAIPTRSPLADGRFVLFESVESAAEFVPGATDANAEADLFLWDAQNDTFQLVSHAAGNNLLAPPAGHFGSHWHLRPTADTSLSSPTARPSSPATPWADTPTPSSTIASMAAWCSPAIPGPGPGAPANDETLAICAISPEGAVPCYSGAAPPTWWPASPTATAL